MALTFCRVGRLKTADCRARDLIRGSSDPRTDLEMWEGAFPNSQSPKGATGRAVIPAGCALFSESANQYWSHRPECSVLLLLRPYRDQL